MSIKTNFVVRAMATILYIAFDPLTVCAEQEDSTNSTRDIVIALFAAFNAHDLDAVLALYHPEVMKKKPDHPESRYGKDMIRENYSALFQLPGVHDTVHRIVVEGNQASIEFTGSWWNKAITDGTLTEQSLKVAAFLTIEDGKIVEEVTYYNRLVGDW